MRPATGDQQRTRDGICNAELDSADDQQLSLANERRGCAVRGGASVVVRFGFSLRYTANEAGEAALRLPWVEPILIEIFSNLARSADRDVLLCRIVASM